jgi:hypothetical protein
MLVVVIVAVMLMRRKTFVLEALVFETLVFLVPS